MNMEQESGNGYEKPVVDVYRLSEQSMAILFPVAMLANAVDDTINQKIDLGGIASLLRSGYSRSFS